MVLMLRDYIIRAILILLTRLIVLENHVESPFCTGRSGWPKRHETASKIYSITFLYLSEKDTQPRWFNDTNISLPAASN